MQTPGAAGPENPAEGGAERACPVGAATASTETDDVSTSCTANECEELFLNVVSSHLAFGKKDTLIQRFKGVLISNGSLLSVSSDQFTL